MSLAARNGEECQDLVICNNCLGAASVLRGSVSFKTCPTYCNSNVDTIPINDHAAFKMKIRGKNVENESTRES